MRIPDFDKQLISKSEGTDRFPVLRNFLQKVLSKFQLKVSAMPDPSRVMITDTQRVNLYHLMQRVIDKEVDGEVVELGCFEGQTALFIKKMLDRIGSEKRLILYDNFRHQIGIAGNIRERLISNFQNSFLHVPELVEGDFWDTLPGKLPEKIAFAHIDCGFGGDQKEHQKVVLHVLQSIYPRMEPGAFGVLMDYHDPERTVEGLNANPGVKSACDLFFKDKKENIFILYGGEYSHAAFYKMA